MRWRLSDALAKLSITLDVDNLPTSKRDSGPLGPAVR
jgi:hypothetical protein